MWKQFSETNDLFNFTLKKAKKINPKINFPFHMIKHHKYFPINIHHCKNNFVSMFWLNDISKEAQIKEAQIESWNNWKLALEKEYSTNKTSFIALFDGYWHCFDILETFLWQVNTSISYNNNSYSFTPPTLQTIMYQGKPCLLVAYILPKENNPTGSESNFFMWSQENCYGIKIYERLNKRSIWKCIFQKDIFFPTTQIMNILYNFFKDETEQSTKSLQKSFSSLITNFDNKAYWSSKLNERLFLNKKIKSNNWYIDFEVIALWKYKNTSPITTTYKLMQSPNFLGNVLWYISDTYTYRYPQCTINMDNSKDFFQTKEAENAYKNEVSLVNVANPNLDFMEYFKYINQVWFLWLKQLNNNDSLTYYSDANINYLDDTFFDKDFCLTTYNEYHHKFIKIYEVFKHHLLSKWKSHNILLSVQNTWQFLVLRYIPYWNIEYKAYIKKLYDTNISNIKGSENNIKINEKIKVVIYDLKDEKLLDGNQNVQGIKLEDMLLLNKIHPNYLTLYYQDNNQYLQKNLSLQEIKTIWIKKFFDFACKKTEPYNYIFAKTYLIDKEEYFHKWAELLQFFKSENWKLHNVFNPDGKERYLYSELGQRYLTIHWVDSNVNSSQEFFNAPFQKGQTVFFQYQWKLSWMWTIFASMYLNKDLIKEETQCINNWQIFSDSLFQKLSWKRKLNQKIPIIIPAILSYDWSIVPIEEAMMYWNNMLLTDNSTITKHSSYWYLKQINEKENPYLLFDKHFVNFKSDAYKEKLNNLYMTFLCPEEVNKKNPLLIPSYKVYDVWDNSLFVIRTWLHKSQNDFFKINLTPPNHQKQYWIKNLLTSTISQTIEKEYKTLITQVNMTENAKQTTQELIDFFKTNYEHDSSFVAPVVSPIKITKTHIILSIWINNLDSSLPVEEKNIEYYLILDKDLNIISCLNPIKALFSSFCISEEQIKKNNLSTTSLLTKINLWPHLFEKQSKYPFYERKNKEWKSHKSLWEVMEMIAWQNEFHVYFHKYWLDSFFIWTQLNLKKLLQKIKDLEALKTSLERRQNNQNDVVIARTLDWWWHQNDNLNGFVENINVITTVWQNTQYQQMTRNVALDADDIWVEEIEAGRNYIQEAFQDRQRNLALMQNIDSQITQLKKQKEKYEKQIGEKRIFYSFLGSKQINALNINDAYLKTDNIYSEHINPLTYYQDFRTLFDGYWITKTILFDVSSPWNKHIDTFYGLHNAMYLINWKNKVALLIPTATQKM